MPSWRFTTPTMPPPTPLLAGTPTSNAQLPEKSYIPQVNMTASVLRTAMQIEHLTAGHRILADMGQVAPMRARSAAVTMIEHWRK